MFLSGIFLVENTTSLIKHAFTLICFFMMILFISACNPNEGPADDVIPSTIFSDNMVLQREKPITIWGLATPNSIVQVLFNGQHISTCSKKDSSWIVTLKPEKAGGAFNLLIIAKDTICYENVMVGEVWICSGQSNMQMEVGNAGRVKNYKQEVAEADYPDIRIGTIQHNTTLLPQTNARFGNWEVCTPQSIEHFSATAYFFARKLYQELHVPIGVIHASSGGTPVEAWTSTEFIQKATDIKPMLAYEDRIKGKITEVQASYNQELEYWNEQFQEQLSKVESELPNMAEPALDDSQWDIIKLPQPWEEVEGGLGYTDGVVWFRKTIRVDAQDIKDDEFEISLGYIHDENKTFINGQLIGEGETRWGSEVTKYKIPKGLIKAGENTIAVRITNYDWIGGICRDEENLWLKNSEDFNLNLIGDWKYRMIFNFNDFPEPPDSPSDSDEAAVLFNGMINPITSMAIRGCIWYQGENNVNRPIQYRRLFSLLIESWRKEWKQGDFPFYYVQLANFMGKEKEPIKSNWAALRDAQNTALSIPNTGQAVAIDLGEADNIHPKNKQDVGLRLALNALNQTYGIGVEYSGPVFESMQILRDTIALKFSHIGEGLILKDPDSLMSFAIAGSDKKFFWAKARIVDENICVWSESVSNPIAVRYGWANNPDCNLYNAAGLPASPFRTDDWELELELDFKTFPKIDAHIHLYTEDDSYMNVCEEYNLHLLTIATNSEDLPLINDQVVNANMLNTKYPETVSYTTCFGMENFTDPDWTKNTIAKLKQDFDGGALAVKVWKDIGMTHRNTDSSFILMDDERFDSIWSYIASENKILVNHVGDPKNCWLPLSEMTVDNDRWYFSDFPEYHMYLHPEHPSHEELMQSRDHVLDKHPNLHYVGCHLGSLEYSLEKQAEFLDKYPNASFDMAARIVHFQVQNRDSVRAFINKYQDRLLYGTDIVLYDGKGKQSTFLMFRDKVNSVYLNDWNYFTTDNIFEQTNGTADYQGLDLPNKVLEKIYYQNALRVYPGLFSK